MKAMLGLLLSVVSILSAQQASVFFPQLGSKWYYKTTPLDTLNKPIDSLSFFRTDSFALQTDYRGKSAGVIISKASQFDEVPYFDTSYIHLEGTDAWSYMDAFSVADSIGAADSIGVISFLSSFSGWYPVFKFAQAVNIPYTLVEKDTTFTLDSLIIPVSISVKAKRLQDQTTTTQVGTFDCKKFLISPLIGIKLGPLVIPLIQMEDTVWIAENRWVVKDVRPSTKVSLALYGGPSFSFPGSITILSNRPTSVPAENNIISGYTLAQNYPNPFNPETIIEYNLTESSEIRLAIYNSAGELVQVLFKGEQSPGLHSLTFKANNLTSGVYYYKLTGTNFSETKKMILLK